MTQQKIITILLNLVVIVFFGIGFYIGNKYSKDAELIKEQRNTINRQRNIIELLERNKDSLRITRAEFESAVKLLESKK